MSSVGFLYHSWKSRPGDELEEGREEKRKLNSRVGIANSNHPRRHPEDLGEAAIE